jgi:hypothetical protein
VYTRIEAVSNRNRFLTVDPFARRIGTEEDGLPQIDRIGMDFALSPCHLFIVTSQSLGGHKTCQVRHATFLPGKLLHWRT